MTLDCPPAGAHEFTSYHLFKDRDCVLGLPQRLVGDLPFLLSQCSVNPCGMSELNEYLKFIMKKIFQPIRLANGHQAPYRFHSGQLELCDSRIQFFLGKLIVVINITEEIRAGLLRMFL